MLLTIPYLNLIVIVAIIFLMIAMFAIMYIDTTKIKELKYTIKNNKVYKGIETFKGFKIVFFSDLHIGKLKKKNELNKIVELLKSYDADIYIFGGDLIGSNIKKHFTIQDVTESFAVLSDKCLISVYGNHEYKLEKNITTEEKFEYFKAMGFKILKDDGYTYYKNDKSLSIYGMNDYIYNDVKMPIIKYDLIISHEGDIIEKINNQIMLSGHTHGGQIRLPLIPIFYKPKHGKKFTSGLYNVNSSNLIVSNGLGFNGIKVRFFAKRDIIIIDYQK